MSHSISDLQTALSSSLFPQLTVGIFLLFVAWLVYRRFGAMERVASVPPVHGAHIAASATALDTLTSTAQDHALLPVEHIHAGAAVKHSHIWLAKYIPDPVLHEYENRHHVGNYVMDRVTGEKTFEQMSIYVRVGMHLLYYESRQAQILHVKRVQEVLRRAERQDGPGDYHRWHAPVTGTVDYVKKIPGTYYTVNPQAISQEGTLNVFVENRRDVMIMHQPVTGNKVAVVAVGAMLVGSIKRNPGMEEPGKTMKRADCQGAFQCGRQHRHRSISQR
ncbi:hypothetical protein G647_04178 [Cladophialophora carrionii CBS 160.54]|uniref:Phosphatidylserine decarboxylase n=1 Tax=Cladophialophora carrionii CBS 160.54 TaxID=1279043 RepID=V9DEP2_9EURO|nr:uncharacterized protein G647_04178 [Cladophialophora carrionii CBS 160.54]ETI24808.1 hypothetical protein G647_04178 [Cladophialophora carrionii CBS 160.54]